MATETKNLGLYLEDNATTKFKEWRDKMNGPTGSNMEKIDTAVAGKQDKITGKAGQVVGFDANGNAVPQAAPDTGVTTFKGRTGAVTPQSGDYTAEQVGARPSSWTPTAAQVGAVPTSRKVNNKALSADISLTASDVGARPSSWTPTAAQVGAVPTSRKVNNKALSGDITLSASDVGALASGGTAAAATKLATARTVQTNLASTSAASFNGTANISPGVTGILSLQNGGTGVDNMDDLKAALGLGVSAATLGVSSVLNDNSWADIKKISDQGIGANCWSVGDTKSILIKGTIGTLAVNATCWAFILGFNHNSGLEGKGITFGGFKTAQTGGKDICLVDAKYNTVLSDGTKCFNLNHWGNASASPYNTNYGGWKGCDARYDILGSTNKAPSGYGSMATTSRVGYDPDNYDIVSSPVANTLMAALPLDLRSVMKPITKYTDNKGNNSNTAAGVSTSIDYLPLLAEFEIFGTRACANTYEKNYQKQYAYYAAGNSKVRYRHSSTTSAAWWWERSPGYYGASGFCYVASGGGASYDYSRYSSGLAPAFMV